MFKTIQNWLRDLFSNTDDLYQLDSAGTVPHTHTIYLPRTAENRFRPFFVHRMYPEWAPKSKHRAKGFTVYIQPGPDDRRVGVSIAWCSGKDEFIKKEGRNAAMAKAPMYMNPRDVPAWIGAQYEMLIDKIHYIVGNRGFESEYFYVLKYML